jgi:hypothetical protein
MVCSNQPLSGIHFYSHDGAACPDIAELAGLLHRRKIQSVLSVFLSIDRFAETLQAGKRLFFNSTQAAPRVRRKTDQAHDNNQT